MASGNLHTLQKKHQKIAYQILNVVGEQALAGCTKSQRLYCDKFIPTLKAIEMSGSVEIKQFMVEHEQADTETSSD